MGIRSAGLAIISLFASGCQYASQATAAPSYEASLDVQAEQCGKTCDFTIARVRVKNTGTDLLCIPSVYSDEGGFGALILGRRSNNEPVELIESYDPNPFLSPRYREDMLVFAALPQRVLQPGQAVEIRMTFFRKFELAPLPTEATLRFVGFACRQREGEPLARIENLRANVAFS